MTEADSLAVQPSDCTFVDRRGLEMAANSNEKTFTSIRHLLDGSDFLEDNQWDQQFEKRRGVAPSCSFTELVSNKRCFKNNDKEKATTSSGDRRTKQQSIFEAAFSVLTEGACEDDMADYGFVIDESKTNEAGTSSRPSLLHSMSKRDTPKIHDVQLQIQKPSEPTFDVEHIREDALARHMENAERLRRTVAVRSKKEEVNDPVTKIAVESSAHTRSSEKTAVTSHITPKTPTTGVDSKSIRSRMLTEQIGRRKSFSSAIHIPASLIIEEDEPTVNALDGAAARRMYRRRVEGDSTTDASTSKNNNNVPTKPKVQDSKFVGVTMKTTSRRQGGLICPETPRAAEVEGVAAKFAAKDFPQVKLSDAPNSNQAGKASTNTANNNNANNTRGTRTPFHAPKYTSNGGSSHTHTRRISMDSSNSSNARTSSLDTININSARRSSSDTFSHGNSGHSENETANSSTTEEKPKSRRRSVTNGISGIETTPRSRSKPRILNGSNSNGRKNCDEMKGDVMETELETTRRSRSRSKSRIRNTSGRKSTDEIRVTKEETEERVPTERRSRSRSKSMIRNGSSSGGRKNSDEIRVQKEEKEEETPEMELDYPWKHNGGDAELLLPIDTLNALLSNHSDNTGCNNNNNDCSNHRDEGDEYIDESETGCEFFEEDILQGSPNKNNKNSKQQRSKSFERLNVPAPVMMPNRRSTRAPRRKSLGDSKKAEVSAQYQRTQPRRRSGSRNSSSQEIDATTKTSEENVLSTCNKSPTKKKEMINSRSFDSHRSPSDHTVEAPVTPRRSLMRTQGTRSLSLGRRE